ncbi:DUF2809 domain-containing protein [Mucilaginibacter terrenus]|uniref:DUF2809 domain-containing protein n=1 Tax=Mucilaginibacter terrenus TaxID=2482727 RepID=A0A3E2NXM6_9SPHI|nr:DUF2809 domain-containing protein [Mucilaginibacter terrenus]RFZ85742.1 DUF2809 domain-containing protein [Mucilaginibacter terrenus]
MRIKFNGHYFALAVLLFITEVLIGVYMNDKIIRPYGGDFLVVILMYCALRAFVVIDTQRAAIGVLVLSYIIEFAQYFHLINLLGWQQSAIARNLLGTTFRWEDMLAYTLGILLVVIIERWLKTRNSATHPNANA